MVERDSLPVDMQPQNRIFGKLDAFWYGMNPYPKPKEEYGTVEDEEN